MHGEFQAEQRQVMLVDTMAGFDGPIYLALSKSKLLSNGAIAAHTLALVAAIPSLSVPAYRAAVCILIVLHGIWVHYRLAQLRDDDITALLLTASEGWRVTLRDGRVVTAELARTAFVSVPLTALSLRTASGDVRHLVLLRDCVARDPYRRLRVRLRFKSANNP